MNQPKPPEPEFKYFKFDPQTAVVIGNMLSAFCEHAVVETKKDREEASICRTAFFDYIGQFENQLNPAEIAEIIAINQEQQANESKLILPEKPKLILNHRD